MVSSNQTHTRTQHLPLPPPCFSLLIIRTPSSHHTKHTMYFLPGMAALSQAAPLKLAVAPDPTDSIEGFNVKIVAQKHDTSTIEAML